MIRLVYKKVQRPVTTSTSSLTFKQQLLNVFILGDKFLYYLTTCVHTAVPSNIWHVRFINDWERWPVMTSRVFSKTSDGFYLIGCCNNVRNVKREISRVIVGRLYIFFSLQTKKCVTRIGFIRALLFWLLPDVICRANLLIAKIMNFYGFIRSLWNKFGTYDKVCIKLYDKVN